MRLLVAGCEVLDTGRLTARLPEAVRLPMLKADGLPQAGARSPSGADPADRSVDATELLFQLVMLFGGLRAAVLIDDLVPSSCL